MGRKDGSTLQSPEKGAQKLSKARTEQARRGSWAAVGIDTSMTAISAVGMGYDANTDKIVGPSYAETRWLPEDEYMTRLGMAAKGHELVLDVIHDLWVIELNRVAIAIEEPVPYGMMKKAQSAWVKQQCEIAGAFKGSLVKWGFPVIYEINNSQWKKTLRQEGVEIRKMPEGKFDVKHWAVSALGMPELPDLISKNGAKIPRPEGSKAKAVQPSDVYDGAAIMAWMLDEVQAGRSVIDV